MSMRAQLMLLLILLDLIISIKVLRLSLIHALISKWFFNFSTRAAIESPQWDRIGHFRQVVLGPSRVPRGVD